MMTEIMNEEFGVLYRSILIAIFLVFLVMAMQFESPRFSFMVMMCIPFSLVGSIFLLFIVGATISMVSVSYTHLDVYKRQSISCMES